MSDDVLWLESDARPDGCPEQYSRAATKKQHTQGGCGTGQNSSRHGELVQAGLKDQYETKTTPNICSMPNAPVGELTELIGSDFSTVSKHLALLRANGIVEDRRQGTTVFYRLLTPCVCNFFACATQVLKEKAK